MVSAYHVPSFMLALSYLILKKLCKLEISTVFLESKTSYTIKKKKLQI